METVTLYRPNDLHADYISPSGAVWRENDAYDDQTAMHCAICGVEMMAGFLCLDGGEEVCFSHVVIVPESIGVKLAAEFLDRLDFHNGLVGMRTVVGTALVETFTGAEQNPNRYLGFVRPTEKAWQEYEQRVFDKHRPHARS